MGHPTVYLKFFMVRGRVMNAQRIAKNTPAIRGVPGEMAIRKPPTIPVTDSARTITD